MSNFTFVQAATPVADASGITHTITYTSASTTGNLLVLLIVTPGAPGISTVTLTSGTVNNAVAYAPSSGGGSPNSGAVYYANSGSNTTQTWTVNLNSGSPCVLMAYEWSGTTSPTFDSASGWTNSSTVGTTATGGSNTPTNANDLAISFLTVLQNNPITSLSFGGGYTLRNSVTQGTNLIAYEGDQTLTGAPSTTPSATWSGSGNQWGICQVFFSAGSPYSIASSQAGSLTGTTGSVTLSEAVATNDLIIVQWQMDNVGSIAVPTITDNVNNIPYSQAGTAVYYSTTSKCFGQSYVACVTGGTPKITITNLSASGMHYSITHVQGFAGIPTLDQLAFVSSAGGTSISNTITTAHSTEFLFTTTFAGALISSTPTGWTSTFSGGNASIDQVYWQYAPNTGAVSLSATLASSAFFYNYEFSFYNGAPPTSYYIDGTVWM